MVYVKSPGSIKHWPMSEMNGRLDKAAQNIAQNNSELGDENQLGQWQWRAGGVAW